MAHIEIVNGKQTMVESKPVKKCMKLEDPKGTLEVFENANKNLFMGDKKPTGK